MSSESSKPKIRLDKVKDLDLYALLEVSLEATEKEIKKAYRKKALKCHPDKNPDDAKAAEQFHLLSQALAVLSDEGARKAYDNVLKAKQAAQIRNRQLDEKRKKLKDDLDAREAAAADREQAFKKASADKSSEESLQRELERLQKEGRQQLEEEQERLNQMLRQATEEKVAATTAANGPAKLKVKWKSSATYTQDQLQSIFHKYGDVDNVVVLAEKRVGLVEMKSRSAAAMASKIETGFSESPFKVKLLDDHPSEDSHAARPTQTTSAKQMFTSAVGAASDAASEKQFCDYETLVMRQMRQAEERKRLEAEILAQDQEN